MGPEAGPARANPAPRGPKIPGGSRAMGKTPIYRCEDLSPRSTSTRQALLTPASPGEGTEESGSWRD